jgi:hypothetical protein
MNRYLAIFMAFALFVGAPAFAAEEAKPAATTSNAFKKFEQDGGKMEFIGNAYGVDGWALINKNNVVQTTIYTTPEGGMVRGLLFDPNGNPLTPGQLAAMKAKKEGSQAALPNLEKANPARLNGQSKAEAFYAQVEKLGGWVQAGAASAPYIYMFMNVGCVECQDTWKKLQGPVNQGTLQVRLVPFGKEPLNRDGGAALLSVDRPGDAWTSYIAGKTEALDKGKIKSGGWDKIDANTKLVSSWKVPNVPFIFYRKLTDGTLVGIPGPPQNIMLLQADLIRQQN